MSRHRVVDGKAGEDSVVVDHDPDAGYYGLWWVWLNGTPVGILNVDTLRDGGTKILRLSQKRSIELPKRLGNPDRTPKLDGVDIV